MQTKAQAEHANEQERLGNNAEQLFGHDGLLKQMSKLLIESALEQEMVEHLGHYAHEGVGNAQGNVRFNGV
jgi:transposase-like protein